MVSQPDTFDIDVDRGVKSICALLQAKSRLPFRFGYFQLSLTGVLLAKLSTASSFSEYRSWIWDEIDYLREEGINLIEDFSLGLALDSTRGPDIKSFRVIYNLRESA
jgi:hypothetical protein